MANAKEDPVDHVRGTVDGHGARNADGGWLDHPRGVPGVPMNKLETEDPEVVAATPLPHEARDAGMRHAGGPQPMSAGEITRFLHSHTWGVLTSIGAEGPYAVPVTYGFDGHALFVATGPGRKASNMEADPRVGLTVLRVTDGSQWCSVVVEGHARMVTRIGEKLRAVGILARQHASGSDLSPRDLARLRGARIFRIEPREIGGRKR